MNPKISRLLDHAKTWQDEMKKIREIVLETGLDEELKWRQPCYSWEGKNIVLIQGFKNYCALMFFKGALLKDPKGVLIKLGVAQAARQIRFTSLGDVTSLTRTVKAYVKEAISVEKAGLKVELKRTSDFEVPAEFQKKLDGSSRLKSAYEALTPGRQRAYLYYFSQAKLSKTREARVAKSVERILKGMGLND